MAGQTLCPAMFSTDYGSASNQTSSYNTITSGSGKPLKLLA
jgi:hypothetical protein